MLPRPSSTVVLRDGPAGSPPDRARKCSLNIKTLSLVWSSAAHAPPPPLVLRRTRHHSDAAVPLGHARASARCTLRATATRRPAQIDELADSIQAWWGGFSPCPVTFDGRIGLPRQNPKDLVIGCIAMARPSCLQNPLRIAAVLQPGLLVSDGRSAPPDERARQALLVRRSSWLRGPIVSLAYGYLGVWCMRAEVHSNRAAAMLPADALQPCAVSYLLDGPMPVQPRSAWGNIVGA